MPTAATLPTDIEIFRAGTHTASDGVTQVTVTHDDLAAIAAAYDPAVGEAPHVIGHPELNAPAYGWVRKLEARNGVLFAAESAQVEPAFAGLVGNGRFKKRSASFFLPDTVGNPTPGKMYLRHVGWLGAAAPAITGLRDVQFSAADKSGLLEFSVPVERPWIFRTIAEIFRRLRDGLVERDGAEEADRIIPAWQLDALVEAANPPPAATPSFAAPAAPQPEPSMSQQNTVDFAAREAQLNTRQQEIDRREAAVRETEAKARRAGVADFTAALVKAGKLLPRHEAPMIELLMHLESGTGNGQPATLNFSAPDGSNTAVQAGAALRTLLSDLPVQVDFAERGAGEPIEGAANFSAPSGTHVERDRLELHSKAEAFRRSHPGTSYLDAVRAVGG